MATFGLAAGILYLVHHMIVKTALLMAGGAAEIEVGSGSLLRDQLSGLSSRRPMLAVVFFIAAMSLAGIPPSSGFVSKLSLLRGRGRRSELVDFCSQSDRQPADADEYVAALAEGVLGTAIATDLPNGTAGTDTKTLVYLDTDCRTCGTELGYRAFQRTRSPIGQKSPQTRSWIDRGTFKPSRPLMSIRILGEGTWRITYEAIATGSQSCCLVNLLIAAIGPADFQIFAKLLGLRHQLCGRDLHHHPVRSPLPLANTLVHGLPGLPHMADYPQQPESGLADHPATPKA